MEELDHYRFGGHSTLMGRNDNPWQDADAVLSLFGKNLSAARKEYRAYVEKGIALGRRAELTGGGLIRSMGGWGAVKSMRRRRCEHLKGDERILGDGSFVESVLAGQNEQLERRYALQAQGCDFKQVVRRVVEVFGIKADAIMTPGKQPARVQARSLACYWAVRELGMTAVAVARLLELTQSAVTKAACRGEKMAHEQGLELISSKK